LPTVTSEAASVPAAGEPVYQGPPGSAIGTRWRRRHFQRGLPDAPAAKPVERGVGRDAEDPSRERRVAAKPLEAFANLRQDLFA